MFVAHIMDLNRNDSVLDACSAPGGKACHIAEILSPEGHVDATDIHDHKIKLIDFNIRKLRLKNIEAYQHDATEPYVTQYDKILVDAPCSGFGVLRHKPEIKYTQSKNSIQSLVELQLQILENVKHNVKPGGSIIYSTCTIEQMENENVVYTFLKQNKDFEFEPFQHPMTGEMVKTLQIFPKTTTQMDSLSLELKERKVNMITDKKKKKNKFLPDFEKQSIYSLRYDEMQNWLIEHGQQKFRAKQIFEWLYQKRVDSIDEMTNLSKDLRQLLKDNFAMTTLTTVVKQESRDGTIKFLFELQDGYTIETVLMRHEYGNSVCVTTQVGCRIGCTFCASTLGGLKRNLEAGEIVSQVLTVQKALDETEERVSQIVIMGIGEPFENYDEMMDFLRIVNDDNSLNIGARHITVSTSGIIPRIYDFAEEDIQINFAVSLHGAKDEVRSRLMPINRAYNVEKLMEAIEYYQEDESSNYI